ncbi:MAG: Stp1/IreP family PP2C-type Ser/Thr phosphatase [Clostridia bacterium]|nr:Stp1/IreP family PP2C-type Ser/Thr phosphatase [Clostridia bacterium]
MFQVAFKTDVGLKRTNNQDTILVCKDIQLCIVADGMGGYKGGEIASLLAVQAIEDTVRSSEDRNPQTLLISAINNANKNIYLRACDEPDLKGMGTTCSMVLIDDQIHIAHVGDSRVYFITDEIKQVTLDHTLVEDLIKRGEINRSEARNHPKRNVITRAVGSDPEVLVDYAAYSLSETEKVLICSDGLTGKITDNELLEIILKNDLQEAVDQMIQLANERGGSDNISVILLSL